jgi:hypothetical protein
VRACEVNSVRARSRRRRESSALEDWLAVAQRNTHADP